MRTTIGAMAMGIALLGVVATGCGRHAQPPRVTIRWLAGRAAPAFDPGGPPDPLRRALERMLSYGLFERDSAGRVVPLAADSAATAADSRTYTVRLRAGLRFTDGSEATSADFRAALLAALRREDHSTAAWLLAPVAGVDRIRPGRPLPAIGIEAPDARTLRFRLTRPDTAMADRLAAAGLGVPWRRGGGGSWNGAVGLGPYRVASEETGRSIVLVRAGSCMARHAIADTVEARFAQGAPRARLQLRRQAQDLVWPLPPSLLAQVLPPGYRLGQKRADPPQRLLLVLRADVPPTTSLAARNVLAHSLNRADLLEALGLPLTGNGAWLEGAGPFEFPRLDAAEARQWMTRGGLGASFHVVLAYDADGEGAQVARVLQGDWAALGLYAELRALRGREALAEPLRPAAAQAQLLTAQAPVSGAAGELATLVMPMRGAAIGSFRTGWRTREFDRWIAGGPGGPPPDAKSAQARLAEERVALPLAEIPWRWVERVAGPVVAFRKEFGPDFAPAGPSGQSALPPRAGIR